MKRYHKKIYIPENSDQKIKDYTDMLNSLSWRYTRHTLDNLKYRSLDLADVLNFVKGIRLEAGQMFEFYTDYKGNIFKACYRLPYMKDIDIILVISYNKNIVTIYFNSTADKHETLQRELYTIGG